MDGARPAGPAPYPSILTATVQHLQTQPIHGRKRRARGDNLHTEDLQCRPRSPRQSRECEERNDWDLSSHQELPNVGGGSLVSFAGCTEYSDVQEDCSEGSEGHSDRYPGGGLFE